MLELNISFIFHLLFIIIGIQIITLFFNKLYDNIIEYKNKEKSYINAFNIQQNILKTEIIDIENICNNNIKDINVIIKNIIIKKKSNSIEIKMYLIIIRLFLKKTKQLIDNYFFIY